MSAHKLSDVLIASHFKLEQMGGGFVQYVQTVDDDSGAELRLTDGNCNAPKTLDDPCTLVFDENETSQFYTREFASVTDALRWIEEAEYVLPENGDGPVANGWTSHAK